jgi:hypothetical protein
MDAFIKKDTKSIYIYWRYNNLAVHWPPPPIKAVQYKIKDTGEEEGGRGRGYTYNLINSST